ncbi:hypothetical protein BJ170DRAFT_609414 [Xylariales sp. AK1849]|nr:hypothetical protein BJ170DRAFT_609414 [Xylariales sp. AK1849]
MLTEAVIDALRSHLSHFPVLRSKTITPVAHEPLFSPRYETPMIRTFPMRGIRPCHTGLEITLQKRT